MIDKILKILDNIVSFGVSFMMAISFWGGIRYFTGEPVETSLYVWLNITVWAIVIHSRRRKRELT